MKFIEFVLKYRFSFIDVLWIMLTAQLFINGMFLFGIISAALGAAFTILTEVKLKKDSEEEKQSLKDHEWKRLADSGQMVNAIKRYRSLYGAGLMEARSAVFRYLGRPE